MTGPEHYREAERLLAKADKDGSLRLANSEANALQQRAQVHATLALAAATALVTTTETCWSGRDVEEWAHVASVRKPTQGSRS